MIVILIVLVIMLILWLYYDHKTLNDRYETSARSRRAVRDMLRFLGEAHLPVESVEVGFITDTGIIRMSVDDFIVATFRGDGRISFYGWNLAGERHVSIDDWYLTDMKHYVREVRDA